MGDVSARITTLVHELANILDGSLRCLQLAMRAIPASPAAAPIASEAARAEADLRARLSTVEQSLLRMGELVRRVASPALSAQTLASSSLLEAIQHAAAVTRAAIRPDTHGPNVMLDECLDPSLARAHTGDVYPVVLNALRNALDAMARRSDRARPGRIILTAGFVGPGTIRIEVADDGPGIDPTLDPARAFRAGVSTKPGSAGVGLALAAQVVHGLGGRLVLAPRPGGGAVFCCEIPQPRDWGSMMIGGPDHPGGAGSNGGDAHG